MQTEEAFLKLCDIVAKLRGPGGCPWDIEQTPQTLRSDLVEETWECFEALTENDVPHIREELGDVFLLVTMLSYMHQEKGAFSIADVLEGICEKLIRRHPHVFAGIKVKDTAEVLDNWAKIKVEQEGRKPGFLDGIPQGLPPLERAVKLQKKAAKTGFDLPDTDGTFKKVDEKLSELKNAMDNCNSENIEDKLGDILFMAVNLCRLLKTDPSSALAKTNAKFINQFSSFLVSNSINCTK